MKQPKILARYADTENGVEARVTQHVRGYCVTVWDTDADEPYPMAITYPTIERADAAAREAVFFEGAAA